MADLAVRIRTSWSPEISNARTKAFIPGVLADVQLREKFDRWHVRCFPITRGLKRGGPIARIAFILGEMFEDAEFREPYDRLGKAGHEVVVIGSVAMKPIQGKRGTETVVPDQSIHDVTPGEFDALVIPGGYSPDRLRMDSAMVDFTREFAHSGKPVAAICHGPWMFAEADVIDGRTVTSWPSIKTDLINAGAKWTDREVVEDGNLITSRKPADLPAFTQAILRQLEGNFPDRMTIPRERAARPATPPAI